MIFQIKNKFVHLTEPADLSDICCNIIANKHFIICGKIAFRKIKDAIEKNASTNQKNLFSVSFSCFSPTIQQKKYMAVVDIDGLSSNQLKVLIEKPAHLMLENAINEWQFYNSLSSAFSTDRQFGNLFMMVKEAIENHNIVPRSQGGYTQYVPLVLQTDNNEYEHVYKYKVLIIFDRDTDSCTCFDHRQDSLFKFLCSKTADDIEDSDVYTLSQPGFLWHCWYKRSIENYFPDRLYREKNVDIASLPTTYPDRDYFHIDGKQCPNYSKDMVKYFSEKMTKEDFNDSNIKKFRLGSGETLSEYQLLLLKMVKII
ncbi:MAG: hypothetical protein MSS41_02625 [Collinsella sp.]|nr:hypothetical protein [Collinsella sp.]